MSNPCFFEESVSTNLASKPSSLELKTQKFGQFSETFPCFSLFSDELDWLLLKKFPTMENITHFIWIKSYKKLSGGI